MWRTEKRSEFSSSLNKIKIDNLHKYLRDLESNLNSVTKQTVTSICNKISDIFLIAPLPDHCLLVPF